ncbi:MAG: hypothetical protein MUP82_10570 [Candidatus Marinimicrobia bacterium]|nr:hypothetical protein [Candidatus Neomarinimicrobiota bacterium]
MNPEQKIFSKKFYIGIGLIVSSLIIGKVTQTTFIIYFTNDFIRNLSVIVYIISWIPFVLGITWAGKEYVNKYNRFFTFKYYKNKIKSIRE